LPSQIGVEKMAECQKQIAQNQQPYAHVENHGQPPVFAHNPVLVLVEQNQRVRNPEHEHYRAQNQASLVDERFSNSEENQQKSPLRKTPYGRLVKKPARSF